MFASQGSLQGPSLSTDRTRMLPRQDENVRRHRRCMKSTAQLVGAHLLGLKGDLILPTPRPRGWGHYDLPIRREDAYVMFVTIHHEGAHCDRISLLYRHKPRGKRVALDFPLLWGGFIRLPRPLIGVAL